MANGESLSRDFERAMRDACAESTTLGYYPDRFIQMLNDLGGVGAVKRLLSSDEIQYGLARLWEMGALRLSAEAHVLQAKWGPCSPMRSARKRGGAWTCTGIVRAARGCGRIQPRALAQPPLRF